MANLFAGLENLGLGGLNSEDVFKEEKKEKKPAEEMSEEEKEAKEEDFIFDKSYTCPVMMICVLFIRMLTPLSMML